MCIVMNVSDIDTYYLNDCRRYEVCKTAKNILGNVFKYSDLYTRFAAHKYLSEEYWVMFVKKKLRSVEWTRLIKLTKTN